MFSDSMQIEMPNMKINKRNKTNGRVSGPTRYSFSCSHCSLHKAKKNLNLCILLFVLYGILYNYVNSNDIQFLLIRGMCIKD